MTVTIGWAGPPCDPKALLAIQREIMRAALSEPQIRVRLAGVPVDAGDPLWRLGSRLDLHDEWPPPAGDTHILLAPWSEPPPDPAAAARALRALGSNVMAGAVIASAVPPYTGLIRHEINGFLVETNRPRDWNRRILELAHRPTLRVGMALMLRRELRASA